MDQGNVITINPYTHQISTPVYIMIDKKDIDHTIPLDNRVLVDYAKDGSVVGIEVREVLR